VGPVVSDEVLVVRVGRDAIKIGILDPSCTRT
jgi:hypothetical protein